LVITLRFGLFDGVAWNRTEIGKALGLNRESIRLIEMRAIQRLQHPSRKRKLKGI